ncbi:hypothetical protein CROQUDRAFT_499249 [Cronartium quercuum f. sp. fusiforme G11]|uniref:Uncharacterized protein n=1 Tax=Cronartium quercuum f. sp. fusiforme G11 TaxID=708437 RepID=A0A9P6TC16_9BASI|nr:hypothetical protein CROQUDRAFT_499249 [Cronartium quercuum f. sp. fusiforme G11]
MCTPRGHFLAKDGPKRVNYRDRCQNDTESSQPQCKTMSQRSATLTVLRRISEHVTPPLKRVADRRKIQLNLPTVQNQPAAVITLYTTLQISDNRSFSHPRFNQ